MLVEQPKTLRNKILRVFPLPKNEDILVYNINFRNLANKDVDQLYFNYYSQYKEKSAKYIEITNKLKEYDDFINNAPLVNTKLNEKEYIYTIQQLETEYAKKYSIKNIEKKIETYNNRISQQNILIEKQIKKEEKELEELTFQKMEELKQVNIRIGELETYVSFFQNYEKDYAMLIKMIAQEKKYYERMREKCETDESFCDKCRKRRYPDPRTLEKNIAKIQERMQDHNYTFVNLKQKESDYKLKLKETKKRAAEIKKEIEVSSFLSTKKSPEVLRLEGIKFSLFNEVEALNEELKNLISKENASFRNLKNKIQLYRESLTNLLEMRRISKEIPSLKENSTTYADEIASLKVKLNLIVTFIETRYKVYSNRLSSIFDDRVKFTFCEVNEFEIKEILQIKYDNIATEYLTFDQLKELNTLINSKLMLDKGE